jgi:8-amino-7-oxononanoate synthase
MPGGNPLDLRIRARLDSLRESGLLRTLRPPSGADFSSNDYLNLAADPRVVHGFVSGAAREGCGSTGSRLLRGDRTVFAAVERRFAQFKGAERALLFSSGYLANLAVLATLAEAEDVIFSDERNHASLIDGVRLSRARKVVFPHSDVGALDQLMASVSSAGLRFVVVESLYSMDGDVGPLAEYDALCRRRGALLIVDEAHAVGVFGARGSGLIEAAGLDPTSCVSVNPAGKALGAAGAFVAGPARLVDYLVQRARPFVFSTAPPPSLAGALDASLTIVGEEPVRRERLLARAAYFRSRLRRLGLSVSDEVTQIVPVIIGDNLRAVAVADQLQAEGFDVRAIRPPAVPVGSARLRISLNAALTEGTLDRFSDALVAALTGHQCFAVSS